jgi:hypothetical protein
VKNLIFLGLLFSFTTVAFADESPVIDFKVKDSTVSSAISKMETSVTTRDYQQFRSSLSFAVKKEPSQAEMAQIQALNNSLPPKERAIIFSDRYSIDSLNKTFTADFDSMTKADFLSFVESYIKFQTRTGSEKGDETYLERVFDQVPIPKAEQILLEERIVDGHLQQLNTLRKAGQLDQWRNDYEIGQWMNILAYKKPSPQLVDWESKLERRIDTVAKESVKYGSDVEVISDESDPFNEGIHDLSFYLGEAMERAQDK